MTGVAAGHEARHKPLASTKSPEPERAGGADRPSAEILSFQRGEKLLRSPGTWTENLWRRNRRFLPSPSDVYTPPEPRLA